MIYFNFSLTYLEIYLLCINIIAFITYGIDKAKALKSGKNTRRISENTLFFLVFIGGSIGAILSMITFRHKIKKLSFMLKYILIIIVQVLVYLFI